MTKEKESPSVGVRGRNASVFNPLCPKCEIEMTWYHDRFQCEMCGRIHGESDEEAYSRTKKYVKEKMERLK